MSSNRLRLSRLVTPCCLLALGLLLASGCASGNAPAGVSQMRGLNKNEAQELLAKQQAAREEEEKKNLEAPDPKDLEAHGDRLALAGEWLACLAQYSRALALAPEKDQYRLKTKMAEASLRDRQFIQAEALFRELAQKNPQDATPRQGLGLACLAQGREREAREALLQAVQRDANLWRAHSGLGILYNNSRQPQKAVASFQRAVDLEPGAPSLYNNLGMAYFLASDLPKAEEAFSRAVRLNPGFKLAHNNLGVVLMKQGRLREAQEHFEAATDPSRAQQSGSIVGLAGQEPTGGQPVPRGHRLHAPLLSQGQPAPGAAPALGPGSARPPGAGHQRYDSAHKRRRPAGEGSPPRPLGTSPQ